MTRPVSFYRDVLGLPLRFESPGWTEFATEGATLALHKAEDATVEGVSTHPAAGQCRPGLCVPDLGAFHARLMELRVACLQPPKDVFGARVAQYQDPDGLMISVGEARK
jgi:catechol 2,3-dioxygenase-like lactoylglutathione lyase family enzyme